MRPVVGRKPQTNSSRWALRYIEMVRSGQIPACRWIRAAVARHLEDLKTAGRRGFYFDEAAAEDALQFFSYLHHSKGEWGGKVFILSPWQQFFVYCLFGWKRKKDDMRRFRTAYLEVARKNGKSTLAAGIGLYMLDGDGEPGAEVYSAATRRDQAKIVHSEATRMVRSSAEIKNFVTVQSNNLHVEDTASKFEPLSADYDSLDGLNVHCALVDEVHAHKSRDLWDILDTATSARRQPLMVGITTAGVNQRGICRELHNHLEKILDKVLTDDAFFGMIFTLDDGDDWEDESNWEKANPNLNVSVKIDDLRIKAARVKSSPSALNAFLRLHLDVWTSAESSWILPEVWNASAGAVDPDALQGRPCYGGLDLSTTTDISALALCFPMEDGSFQNLYEFWIPADNIERRVRRDRVPYDAWVRQGLIHATDGNSIDYDFIEYRILELAAQYKIKELAFDPYNATELTSHMINHGLEMVEFRQGFLSMSPPAKRFETLVLSKQYHHGGNPVMNWMMSNVALRLDPAGNIKPDKEKSREKIDGVIAGIMALARAISAEGRKPSVYAKRGLVVL